MGAWLTGAVCCSRRCGRDDRRDELEELVVGGASGGRDAVGADAGEAGRGEDHLGGHLGGRAGPWAGLQACRALRACRAAARARRARVARESARDRAARARASTIPRGERAGARCARVVRAASADAVGITQRRSRVRVALWPACASGASRVPHFRPGPVVRRCGVLCVSSRLVCGACPSGLAVCAAPQRLDQCLIPSNMQSDEILKPLEKIRSKLRSIADGLRSIVDLFRGREIARR